MQTPDLIVFLYQSRTIYRRVFLDGRLLPQDAQPTWMGYSVGRWEGDTLVVETIGQNGKTWLDMRGLPIANRRISKAPFRWNYQRSGPGRFPSCMWKWMGLLMAIQNWAILAVNFGP